MRNCFHCDKRIKDGQSLVGFMHWIHAKDAVLKFPQSMFRTVYHDHCFMEVAGEDYFFEAIAPDTYYVPERMSLWQKIKTILWFLWSGEGLEDEL